MDALDASTLREPARIAALRRTALLDSPPEEAFDRLARLAFNALGTPVVLVTLVDAERQFFKSSIGLPEPWASQRESPLSHSFCQHAIASGEPLLIEDAREHPLVRDSPAIAEMEMIAFAGIPLRTAEGHTLGAFCAAYHAPHHWQQTEMEVLKEFAAATMHEIEIRDTLRRLAHERLPAEAALRRSEQEFRALIEKAWDIIMVQNADATIRYISPSVQRVLGYTPQEMTGRSATDFLHPEDAPWVGKMFREDMQYPGTQRFLEVRLRHKDDSWRTVEIVGQVTADPAGEPIGIVNTHDITERKQAEEALRQKTATIELLESVAVAANEASTIEDALRPCLARVCDYTGWCLGHVHLRDPAGNLVPTRIWHPVDPEHYRAFRDVTEQMPFGPGGGLPGRTLASGKPEWIVDVTKDSNFPRADAARESGLLAGGAFPLLVGSEVVGVLEFFTDHAIEVDASMLEVMAHVGSQLGRVVEREQAKDALRRSEQRTRAIIEMAHDAFVAINSDGVITDWNAQAESAFGWTRAEAMGRALTETIIPPQYRDAHQKGLEHFLATGEHRVLSQRFEIEALHRDGHAFPVELTISPIKTDGGYAFTSFLHDISERKQAEQALRRSEERYELVSRATSDVIWDWNITRGELTWNNAVQTAFRYRPEQVGTTLEWWYNHIHPEDRERVVTGMHSAIDGIGDVWSDEYRFQRGDGSYAAVMDRGYVVRNEMSEPLRAIGSMVDITARKQEEEAQRFLAQASALLDTSLDPEVTLGGLARLAVPTLADYCLIDLVVEGGAVHRVASAHMDPSKEQLLRKDEHHPADVDPEQHPVVKVVRTGQAVLVRNCTEAIIKAIAHDAEHYKILGQLGLRSFMVVPLMAREHTLGAITLAAAESGRSYSPVELMTAQDLARRAALAIDNAQLYENAQRAIRAREEVLAVVSHDLRNPLNTISLGASALVDASTERRTSHAKYLELIRHAAEQANAMIKNLLDVSGIESGHFSVDPSQQDIAELVQQARDLHLPLAEEKSVRLECEIADNLASAWADGFQLQRVFANLLCNAVKFTPSGGVITLRAEQLGGELRFSVSDTGPGIPPDHLPYVFDRYWQAKRGDRRGAGLGLSIARGIVEAHGGRIWVESTPGAGTTFFFTLPKASIA
ncbi:hypothetical protein BH23GEM5_BH23GEM5_19930 [soil metagenome]